MYYQHSGRFGLGGVALGLITGSIGAIGLAYAYGRGLPFIPEVHLAFFATIFFGGLGGVAAGCGLIWGHVRNKSVALAVSGLSSVLALYFSWAVWIQTIYQRSAGRHTSWLAIANRPAAIWHFMKWINQYGTWGLDSGGPTTGWTLWVVWSVEAALVIGISAIAGAGILLQRPFCEMCGQWCRNSAHVFLTPVQDPAQLKLQLENKDLRALENLGPGARTGDHLGIDVHSCDRCGQFHTLNANQVLIRKRKFGHANVSSQKIVRHLIIGPTEVQTVHNLAERLKNAPKLAPEKARGAAAGGKV